MYIDTLAVMKVEGNVFYTNSDGKVLLLCNLLWRHDGIKQVKVACKKNYDTNQLVTIRLFRDGTATLIAVHGSSHNLETVKQTLIKHGRLDKHLHVKSTLHPPQHLHSHLHSNLVTPIEAFTIDTVGCLTRDDALTIENDRIGIHVADTTGLLSDINKKCVYKNWFIMSRYYSLFTENITKELSLDKGTERNVITMWISVDGKVTMDRSKLVILDNYTYNNVPKSIVHTLTERLGIGGALTEPKEIVQYLMEKYSREFSKNILDKVGYTLVRDPDVGTIKTITDSKDMTMANLVYSSSPIRTLYGFIMQKLYSGVEYDPSTLESILNNSRLHYRNTKRSLVILECLQNLTEGSIEMKVVVKEITQDYCILTHSNYKISIQYRNMYTIDSNDNRDIPTLVDPNCIKEGDVLHISLYIQQDKRFVLDSLRCDILPV